MLYEVITVQLHNRQVILGEEPPVTVPDAGNPSDTVLVPEGAHDRPDYIIQTGTETSAGYYSRITSYNVCYTKLLRAGVGDLDVTCRSKYGRNRKFGREIVNDRRLARFKSAEDLVANIDSIGYLPEGIIAAIYAKQLMEQYKLKLPVVESVYRILNKEEQPLNAVREMVRKLNLTQSLQRN